MEIVNLILRNFLEYTSEVDISKKTNLETIINKYKKESESEIKKKSKDQEKIDIYKGNAKRRYSIKIS